VFSRSSDYGSYKKNHPRSACSQPLIAQETKDSQNNLQRLSKFTLFCLYPYTESHIQDIYKRMARLQKLSKNVFHVLHGHNINWQQRELSKFPVRYSSSLLMLTAVQREQFPRWPCRRRLSVCPVLRCQNL
jgi:hypothetical protein